MKKNIFLNKQLIKKIYYILLSMLLLFIILNNHLGNMDEIWNFSSAKNFSNGLIPYKDFNVIATPFSIFINSLILKIDSSLILYRIMYFIYYLIIILLLDKIFNILKIKEFLKYIIIFPFVFILVNECYLDYNFIQLILILLLIYFHLKNKDYQSTKLNIVIALISGITIINKQSTGLVIAAISILLILLSKFYFKKNITIKFILQQIALMLLPTILFIIYLISTKSFYDFYDQAIIGLTTFTNNYISKIFLFETMIIYLLMIVALYLNKNKFELWIILLYCIASLSFVIPIFDNVHSSFCIVLSFIFLIYIANTNIKKISVICTYAIFPILIVLVIHNISLYIRTPKITTGIYKYIPSTIEQQKVIDNIGNYVITMSKDYDVYIADMSAALFDLNIGKYQKYFDIFLNGNFGINGEKEMLNTIDGNNKIFLIDTTSTHWQAPTKITNYVKEKYNICGNIEYLTVYCNKH